ncbi:ABC transporter ATP-binding protein [Aneurinibacillus migulanus]|jgi:putative ABC transport system ATP-binding protein|uniref:Bacitracin ABC transporter ATP-binding protein n=1 Tax=Aneurinibacillus migulanus TaxID=47500 RepID=A0A0D1XQZ4_ANEMI|nr:ABC transporter ATP-binding protein [Aneurinibacillus migulanus]KIV56736.1 bacitracin ABC transporter ATP-binding protein [Aneurinibacillus migulanus]KON97531.1 bacitracin ABC transporter ATP-binding protein [Aneurinibacillus migulanus]MED0894054.1 ABC transporter ATP-binding protein [Aneurinibacillus migulanus]MED1619228.1 ABC transporter ATP-binding protein [Aneurinibacillus migulanus]SDK37031.1 putative ABC transport system ATP-binding protein [Aneurinibacillus migulanus]
MDILQVSGLHKVYTGKIATHALTDIHLTIEKGEFVGVMGPSGSGKTTLLNMVSTIDTPSSGTVMINGRNPYQMKKNDLAIFRRRQLGFIFQDFNLLETLTIAENIVLPLTLDKKRLSDMEEKLKHVAAKLGISEILSKRTYEISGGQRQRAAIARAIITSPVLLLADEPTGALDSHASRVVLESLEKINQQEGTTIMLVTHDPIAASYCNRIIFIKDGRLAAEIHRGENRQAFFQKIIDTLSFWGGKTNELSSIRV